MGDSNCKVGAQFPRSSSSFSGAVVEFFRHQSQIEKQADSCVAKLTTENPGKKFYKRLLSENYSPIYVIDEYVEATPDSTVIIPKNCILGKGFADKGEAEMCSGLLQKKTGIPHYVKFYREHSPFSNLAVSYFSIGKASPK